MAEMIPNFRWVKCLPIWDFYLNFYGIHFFFWSWLVYVFKILTFFIGEEDSFERDSFVKAAGRATVAVFERSDTAAV